MIVSNSYLHVSTGHRFLDQVFHPETPFYCYFHTRFGHKGGSAPINANALLKDLSQAECVIITDIQNLQQFGFGCPEYYLEHGK